MGQRILTDSHGGRWDVADAENGLRFTHPPDGPSYEVRSDRGVDELRDVDLIRMLDDARAREGEEPLGRPKDGREDDAGSPGGGY